MIKNPKTNEREVKEAKDLPNPKGLKDFINEIAKSFGIKKKKTISLIGFTEDEDEYPINSQDDLNDYKSEIKEFHFYIEDEDVESSNIILNSNKKQEESNSSDKEKIKKEEKDEKNEEEKEDQKSEEENSGDDQDKIEINIDIEDNDIENKLNSQIKVEEIKNDENINDDIEFDINKYTQNLNIEFKNKTDEFIKLFDSKIDKIVTQKSEIIKNKVNSLISEFSKLYINNVKDINNESNNIINDLNDLEKDTNEMSNAMGELKRGISGEQIINNNDNNNELQMSQIIDKKNKKEYNFGANNILEEEDEDEDIKNNDNNNKIEIKFENEVIELVKKAKEAKFMEIENITIENIGTISYKNLYLVKDIEQSSPDFSFLSNSKETTDFNKLSLDGDFEPKKKQSNLVSVKIEYPKINEQYTLILYVREKTKGRNLSKPLKITVKVISNEDEPKNKEEEANTLFQELNNNNNDLSNMFNKQEVIEKIIQLNFDRNSINEWIKAKVEEKKKEEYENLYKELETQYNLKNINIDKQEVIKKIKDENLNKNKIEEWLKLRINEIFDEKAQKLFSELESNYNLSSSGINKEDVINRIKADNFDKEKIENWIKGLLNKPNPPGPNPEVEKLFDDLEEEYSISSIVDKDEVIKKIIELNCDREKINKYIEDSM